MILNYYDESNKNTWTSTNIQACWGPNKTSAGGLQHWLVQPLFNVEAKPTLVATEVFSGQFDAMPLL